MATKFVSIRNTRFPLYELFDVDSVTRFPYIQHNNREILDMVLETGLKMGKEILYPHLADMDRNPPTLVKERVNVHPMVKMLMRAWGEGG